MLKVAMPLNQLDLAVVITSEIVAYQQRRRPPPTNEAAGSMTSTRCPSFGLTGTRTAAGDVSGSFPLRQAARSRCVPTRNERNTIEWLTAALVAVHKNAN